MKTGRNEPMKWWVIPIILGGLFFSFLFLYQVTR